VSRTFKVPVLIKIRASSQEEADRLGHRFMSAAGESTFNNEPALYSAVKWWDLAEISAAFKIKGRTSL